jgi:hypothetical protein
MIADSLGKDNNSCNEIHGKKDRYECFNKSFQHEIFYIMPTLV